jgi:hypothetical protein
LLANRATDIQAAPSGKHDVEQNRIEAAADDALQRPFSVPDALDGISSAVSLSVSVVTSPGSSSTRSRRGGSGTKTTSPGAAWIISSRLGASLLDASRGAA